jgi:hypothetical protein
MAFLRAKETPMKHRSLFPRRLTVVAAALLSLVLAPRSFGDGFFEKAVDVPKETKVPVDITFEKSTILFVESQNDPTEKDVREAKETDPNDNTIVLIRFTYKNDDYVKHKVKLRVVLMGPDGAALAEAGRSAALDPREAEDTISFPMTVKTLDWPKAQKLKVLATFLR